MTKKIWILTCVAFAALGCCLAHAQPRSVVEEPSDAQDAQTDIMEDLAMLGYSLFDGQMIATMDLLGSDVDFIVELPTLSVWVDGELAADASITVTDIGSDWMTVDLAGWTQYAELPAIAGLAEGEWLLNSYGGGKVFIGLPDPGTPMYMLPSNSMAVVPQPQPVQADSDDGCMCAGDGGGKRQCGAAECDGVNFCSPHGAYCRQHQNVCAAGGAAELSALLVPLLWGVRRLRRERVL